MILVISLFGCVKNEGMSSAVRLRNAILQGSGCSFDCLITADYGQKQYEFSEECKVDASGNLYFHVVQPDSISGITGSVDGNGGKLSFDDQVLAFPLLADGLLTPVSAPWFLVRSLISGYINACAKTSDGTQIVLHDSHGQASIEVHVYCDKDNAPYSAEIFWDGSRIITLQVTDFVIL